MIPGPVHDLLVSMLVNRTDVARGPDRPFVRVENTVIRTRQRPIVAVVSCIRLVIEWPVSHLLHNHNLPKSHLGFLTNHNSLRGGVK